jgi:immune inhibitor A
VGKGGLVNVKVRRITEVRPTSSTAPPPATALKGEHKLLVILVESEDSKWPEQYSPSRYRELIFSGSTESMAEYYRENSYGLYRLTGEVVGPIRVPGRMKDYEYQRERPDISRVQVLIERAVKAAAKEIDLQSFDTHDSRGKKKKDGILDHLMVVYAEKTGNFDGFSPIWPHRGSIDLEIGGVRVGSYTILNHAARLGVYVHEFGHDLGLPDLYDRDYSSHGAGDWCTMATGSWLDTAGHPAHISAWGKIRLGWIAPKMISESAELEIPSASEKPFALKVPVGEVDSPEYFLVENRRKVGFDTMLPAEGVLIWHVDERRGHNDDEKHKMIDLVEATKDQDLDRIENYTLPKYPPDVFSKKGKAEFTDESEPSARSYDGSPSQIAVRVLSDPARIMRVSVTRPKIFDPGGVPYVISRDGYNHGRFATVPLGAGSEALMALDSTPGGYLAFAAEAFVAGQTGASEKLTFRVYADQSGSPGKVLAQESVSIVLSQEAYAWVRARLGDKERGLPLAAIQRVWVGVTSEKGRAYPVLNPFSVSKVGRFRGKQSSKKLEDSFNFASGRQAVQDYVIRLSGFGYLSGDDRPEPLANDADPLVVKVKEIDKLADANKHGDALPKYEAVLAEMEKDSRRYESWIPVVVNSIGVSAYELKKYDVALDRFEATLRRAVVAKDKPNMADVYENIGETAFAAGDAVRAIETCSRSYDLNAELARKDRLVENLYWLGRGHQAEKKASEATGFFEKALVATKEAFRQDADQEKEWTERIQRAMRGEPDDEPGVKRRTEEADKKKKKHQAVYTDLLQFLSEDTEEE